MKFYKYSERKPEHAERVCNLFIKEEEGTRVYYCHVGAIMYLHKFDSERYKEDAFALFDTNTMKEMQGIDLKESFYCPLAEMDEELFMPKESCCKKEECEINE